MQEIKYKKMSNRMKDLTGSKIGSLEVIKYVGVTNKNQSVWECKCECGNIKNFTILELHNTKSCGCKRHLRGSEDIIGKKFGRLTVIERVGSTSKGSIYKCLCDCGNYIEVYQYNLVSENTKSCGCLVAENAKQMFENDRKKFIIEGTNIDSIKKRNNKANKNNKSGIKGLYQKPNGKWIAQLTFQSKKYHLGTYNTKEEAIDSYNEAIKKRDEYLRNKGLID